MRFDRFLLEPGAWNWFIVAVALFVLETIVPGVHFIWFGLAAVIVGLLGLVVDIAWEWQLIAFAIISCITVFFVRRYAGPDMSGERRARPQRARGPIRGPRGDGRGADRRRTRQGARGRHPVAGPGRRRAAGRARQDHRNPWHGLIGRACRSLTETSARAPFCGSPPWRACCCPSSASVTALFGLSEAGSGDPGGLVLGRRGHRAHRRRHGHRPDLGASESFAERRAGFEPARRRARRRRSSRSSRRSTRGGRGAVRAADTVWAAEGCEAAAGTRVRVAGVKGTVLSWSRPRPAI